VGVGSIVDRTGSEIDFGVPFKSVLSIKVKAYEVDECPLCKQGIPLVKPGSKKIKYILF
jgi:orotate phosphoribosyltransferase